MVSPQPTLLQQALALHRQGRLAEAEARYREILEQAPADVDALHLLGVIAYQQKDFETAVRLISRALQIDPTCAPAHSNLGTTLRDMKRPEAALASYDRALALRPDNVDDLRRRGMVLSDLGRLDAAVASWDRVLALAPNDATVHFNRGTALLELRRWDEALAGLDRALELVPDHAAAASNRGTVLRALGRLEAALASYDRALAIRPDHAEVLNNRGSVLADLGRPEAALASYDRALALRPNQLDTLINRGTALVALGRHAAAVASYDRALALEPGNAVAHCDRGTALLALERYPEALAGFDRALASNPGSVAAHSNRGTALQALGRLEAALASYDRALALEPDHVEASNNRGTVLAALGRHEEAARAYERVLALAPDFPYASGNMLSSRLQSCDWRDYSRTVETIENAVEAGARAADPFVFLAVSGSGSGQLRCAQIYCADKHPAAGQPVWTGDVYGHDKIRIAYLSGDFRNHPVAHLIAGLIEAHDRSRFETTAISFGPEGRDGSRIRLERAFGQFIDVSGESDRAAAHRMKELEIDIAVDLMGYTQGSRPGILACRPAPVQVSYLGYPGTMGAGWIDYLVADRFIVPQAHRPFYREEIVYLPDAFQPHDPSVRIAECQPSRAEAGLPATGFVFCSFNNAFKIAPALFAVWMRLLGRIEDSVLWLPAGTGAAMANLQRSAADCGIAPDRLVWAPRLPRMADHLARHRLADLMLDTLPYNAHTTASDALRAGLPIVTCAGASYAGRVAGSLLTALGMPELIAWTLEEYEALALELAQDPNRLAELEAKLARNREIFPLFDADRYRRHLESAYETMWARYRRGEKPAGFAVERELG
jgi:protein O-GlcNAc transferase